MTPGVKLNGSSKWLQVIITTLISVNIAMSGWMLNRIIDFEKRISVIEGSRFTANDGALLWREIDKKVNRDQVPPPEVLRRLDAIDNRLTRIEAHGHGHGKQ